MMNPTFTFDHIAQIVPDIAAAVAFYQELMPSTRVLYQDATWAFIEAGGAKLAFVVRDQHPNHLAWRVSTSELTRLATEYEREIKPHRDGTRSFYIDGPGGAHLEIISIEGTQYEKWQQDAGIL